MDVVKLRHCLDNWNLDMVPDLGAGIIFQDFLWFFQWKKKKKMFSFHFLQYDIHLAIASLQKECKQK